MGRLMMLKEGADAIHLTGNLGGMPHEERIYVKEELKDTYIGTFAEGLGYFNIKFKKDDVRALTKEEIDEINAKYEYCNDTCYGKMNYDYEGFFLGYTWPMTKDLDGIGDLFTMEEFVSMVECGGITDYDGFGRYSDGKRMNNKNVDLDRGYINKAYSHVVWYNK